MPLEFSSPIDDPPDPPDRPGRRRALSALFLACGLGAPFLSVLLVAHSALAFPVEVQVVAKVSVGKQPKLLVHAVEAADQVVISLSREDGRKFSFSLGKLKQNQDKEVVLDGTVGRHHYEGQMESNVDGERMSSPLHFETVVAPPLEILVERKDVDLQAQKIRFVASRPVAFATLKVIGIAGQTLFEDTSDVSAFPAKKPIPLAFAVAQSDELLRLELRVEDADGFFRALSLTPWSVHIPHEEVLFASNSAEITSEQQPKLEASLQKIREALGRYTQIQGVQLYIAGHTDTKGAPSHNRELSRKRAQAISAWFVRNGVGIRVFYEGFGESVLKVKTKDEVDEPQNRRVDYILSVEAPSLVGGAWRALN